jgi:hypothetical protein
MQPHEPPAHRTGVWVVRVAWFVVLWLAGVAVVGALAFILRRVLV